MFGAPGPLAIAPAIYSDLGYDPAASFSAVAIVTLSPQVLVVNPTVPAKSVHDLIAFAKANRGKIHFASPGYGSEPHLLGELLRTTAGISIVHVPYSGSAQAIVDLLSGRVQMLFDGPAVIAPYIASGRLRALAVASSGRTPLLPEIPTMIESGFGRFIANYWTSVVVPAGTPADVIATLNDAINDSLQLPDLQSELAALGATPRFGSPQDAGTFLAAQAQKWSVLAQAAGVFSRRVPIAADSTPR